MTTYEIFNDEILLIKPKDVITVSEALSFSTLINQILSNKSIKYVIIDFKETAIISSAFLSALLALKKRLFDLDGEVILTSLNDKVRKILEFAEIMHLFKIFPSVEEGKNYLLNKNI
jgi:anti-anti-sigma factor